MTLRGWVTALAMAGATATPASAQWISPGPLSRAHGRLEGDTHCNDCHATGRGVDTGRCLHCHEDLGARVRAGAGLHGREYRGRSCGSCHVEHVGAGARLIRWPGGRPEAFDHSLAGWPLRGGHRNQACNECHDRRNARGARTYLGLRTACASCHDDVHRGRFGNECASCHDEEGWRRVRMERFDHGRTRFPLRGRHQQVACARCHHDPPQWTGIQFSTCATCHADPHQGRFPQPCATCHTENGWSEVSFGRQNHPGVSLGGGHTRVACERCHDRGNDAAPSRGSACVSCHRPVHEARFGNNCAQCHRAIRWVGLNPAIALEAHALTPFPLRGAHRETECDECHDPDLPRARRWRQLTFDRCIDCHRDDPHRGEFRARAGGECAPCHDEVGFRPGHFGVAEHASTAFALEGRHQAAPCSGCHGEQRPRLDFHVADSACAGCHENPHGDQFAREMQRGGCASCHTSSGWDRPNVDHSIWPLTGAHGLAQCGACHTPTEADRRSGRGASYRGLPRECGGCHDDVHLGQFRLSAPVRECDDCHGTTEFAIARFDHAALTSWPLAGRHGQVRCVLCHASETLPGGAHAQRWRLGYRECRDCHANPHERRAPR